MTSSISEYFSRELTEWRDSIDFYLEEIPEFKERLSEFLQSDSVPKMAARVEHFLNNFMVHQQNFTLLAEKIGDQENTLVYDNAPIDNEAVTTEIKSLQKVLRTKMQAAEKSYIDLKYECFDFFDEIITNKL